MTKGSNKIYNKYYELFIIMQVPIEANKQDMKFNKQDFDDKIMKFTEDFKAILESSVTSIMGHIHMYKPLPS